MKIEKSKLEAKLKSQSLLSSFSGHSQNNNKKFKSIWERKIYEIENSRDFFNDEVKNDEIDTKNEECDCVMCANVGLKKSCN